MEQWYGDDRQCQRAWQGVCRSDRDEGIDLGAVLSGALAATPLYDGPLERGGHRRAGSAEGTTDAVWWFVPSEETAEWVHQTVRKERTGDLIEVKVWKG